MSSAQKIRERDGLIDFVDDDSYSSLLGCATAPSWRVLIVDDEKDVHSATLFALTGLILVGRPLEFLHAYSAAEARYIIETTPYIAVVLLDVVMETDNAWRIRPGHRNARSYNRVVPMQARSCKREEIL